jgi:hypothetical protein
MNTAIALTLYRRPLITKQVLDALLACEGIEGIPVYLSQDWSPEHQSDCEAVRQLALEFQRRHKWPSRYMVNIPKLGIDLNKLSVIPQAFRGEFWESNDLRNFPFTRDTPASRGRTSMPADFVIFLEDDHKISRGALRWFIEMGEKFRNDDRIGFITGYARQTEAEFKSSKLDEFGIAGLDDGCPGFGPSSFATWKDRWDYFLPNDGEDYKRICGEQGLFDHFCHLRHGEKLYKHSNPETIGIDKPKWPGLVGPKIGWENATHTPSKEHWLEWEFSEWGMWSL